MRSRSVGIARVRAALCLAGLLGLGSAVGGMVEATADDGVPAMAQAIKDSNRVYLGWRVFQANCARCHGADATGSDKAPNLMDRVKPMSRTQFFGTVLQRYKWVLPSGEASSEGGSPEALILGLAERQRGELLMPAWEKEPSVKAHVADLYDYLQARANGSVGAGRPPWPGK